MLFMNLENKVAHMEDLGRQIQMRGRRICPREMSQRIEAVTEQDIKRAVNNVLMSNMTYVQLGNDNHVPDLDRFRRRFHIGPLGS